MVSFIQRALHSPKAATTEEVKPKEEIPFTAPVATQRYPDTFISTAQKIIVITLAIFGLLLLISSSLFAAGILTSSFITKELLAPFLGTGLFAMVSANSILENKMPKMKTQFPGLPVSLEGGLR